MLTKETEMRVYINSDYLEAKRLESISFLRGINKYIADTGCKWRPRPAAKTDVAKTWDEAKRREGRV
jgi:hypothetical protein